MEIQGLGFVSAQQKEDVQTRVKDLLARAGINLPGETYKVLSKNIDRADIFGSEDPQLRNQLRAIIAALGTIKSPPEAAKDAAKALIDIYSKITTQEHPEEVWSKEGSQRIHDAKLAVIEALGNNGSPEARKFLEKNNEDLKKIPRDNLDPTGQKQYDELMDALNRALNKDAAAPPPRERDRLHVESPAAGEVAAELEIPQDDPVQAKVKELLDRFAKATPDEQKAIVKELLIMYKNIPNDVSKSDDPELLQKTVQQNRENQLAIISALGQTGVVEALVEIARNNPMLGIHPDHPESLKEYAKHKWAELRAVIEALGAIGTPEARKAIEELKSKLPQRDEGGSLEEFNKEVDATRALMDKYLQL